MVEESTRVRVIRAYLGWTRAQLKDAMNVRMSTVRNWEKGISIMQRSNREVMEKICSEHHIAIRADGYPVPE